MIDGLIQFSLRQRVLVLVLALVLVGLGVWSFGRLPIDAVPDLTNVQVTVNTAMTALGPAEIEQLVTFPIETAMQGIPRVDEVRSLTKYGLSQVVIVFKDGTDVYWARQRVVEGLQGVRDQIPPSADPALDPISSGLGEIFQYTVEGDGKSLTELREVQDWIVRPQLRAVPGIADVNTMGGYTRQYVVQPDPAHLASYDLSFRDLFEALTANNENVGGAYIEHNDENYLVRGVGLVKTVSDLENIVVTTRGGVPVYMRDVATVTIGHDLRTGAATSGGREVVLGTAMMLIGENSRTVATRVRDKLAQIQKTLPPGFEIHTQYDRSYLVATTIHTVTHNLLMGGVLVVAVLLLLLGDVRGALIVSAAIPLSMLFAVTGMLKGGVSGNLMSLGAIDFGLIVDGAVVMVENAVRRLGEKQRATGRVLTRNERMDTLRDAAREMGRPVAFAVGIIMIVYVPLLTLHGIEGRMFRPMALTVLLALSGSLILTLTLVPVLCSLSLRRVSERPNRVMIFLTRAYRNVLSRALRFRWITAAGAVLLVAAALWTYPRLGAVFVPQLNEGALAIEIRRLPSISLAKAVDLQKQLDLAVAGFPEVETEFARAGTGEIATDPDSPDVGDTYIVLKPQREWTTARSRAELEAKMQERMARVAGVGFSFSQPIEMRVDELVAGVKTDVAVKVFGDDLDVLNGIGNRVRALVAEVPGATDVSMEAMSGVPMLQISVDRDALASYGINASEVLDVVETAIGGKKAGQMFDGDRRFDVVVRLPEQVRGDIDEIAQLMVKTPSGALIPLSRVASVSVSDGINRIHREGGKRRIVVQSNVSGRDLAGFVREIQARVDATIKPGLPADYYIEYGGQYGNLVEARRRLLIVVPMAMALILFLLFSTFGSVRQSLLVFTGVPLAVTGGVFALALRGIPFSISAGVGFIALSGVAVLNGVVLVSYMNRLRGEGHPLSVAVVEGAATRLRPVLMTALVASLGFIPMAFATGPGSEVQRPLATVVIGGLISSTLLTLLVLPLLYGWFERDAVRSHAAASFSGAPDGSDFTPRA